MQPSRINVSIGTAGALGLAEVPMADAPTTAYLLLGGRCLMNCAFCAQARQSQADAQHLSRVTWPEFDLPAVAARLAAAATDGQVGRACLQVTVTVKAFQQALSILRAVRSVSDVPFDMAILPHDLEQVCQLLTAGADHIGFGLDAACERDFQQVKRGTRSGQAWKRSLALIEGTARAFPGRAALHLIVGLGETEQEMVERIQWAHDQGVTVGLFAFTPVRGTGMAALAQPPLATYRRMQAACWLIVHDAVRREEMAFDARGRLIGLGAAFPATGEPFQTSGCPDCNRPYYNERPGGVIYNYPRPLSPGEAGQAITEMEIEI
jgi:biotin synthase-related radical SAM superfamily protein